jgi:hypothetical protein
MRVVGRTFGVVSRTSGVVGRTSGVVARIFGMTRISVYFPLIGGFSNKEEVKGTMTDHHGPQRTDKVRVNPEKRKRRPSDRFPKANSLDHGGPPRATAAQTADKVRLNISLDQQS